MRKSRLPKAPRIYLTFFILWVILLVIMPRTGKFNYDYRKGSPWTYETLVAQFDFPILKTQDQLQAERSNAGSSVIPYYRYSDEVAQTSVAAAEALNFEGYPNLRQVVISSINDVYVKGVVSEEGTEVSQNNVIFIQRDKRAVKSPFSDVHSVSSARSAVLSEALKAYPGSNVDSVLTANGVYDLLVPNLVFDKETTELVHAENVDYISPTMGFVNAGQLIVSNGELVTAEIQQMLDSYKAEYENSVGYSGPVASLWAGNAILALVLVLILFFSVVYTNPVVFEDWRKFTYLIFVFAMSSAAAILVERFDPELIYLTPFTLTALYLLAFFLKRVVLPVYVISLIPLMVFAHNGVSLFVMFTAAGVVTMFVHQFFSKGWKQFVMALITFVVLLICYAGFCLINDVNLFSNLHTVLYLLIGSFLSVAGYPLVFLFEKIFVLVSNNRLLELCDTTNSSLIKELSQKAPGTFHHSLQVMNMAEALADEIGADSLLARTGALYHDIGKMVKPMCFIENENMGNKYHSGLSAKESAREITKHVTDGIDIAVRNSLPQVIIDFIETHHGDSVTGYFYNKYLNEGGDPTDVEDFFYQGRKPRTKEESIVMICDTVEAASRTLKDNNQETFDKFVDGIVASKIAPMKSPMDPSKQLLGQLSESDLTLKEIEIIKAKLKSYLSEMYHDRIAYPDRNS